MNSDRAEMNDIIDHLNAWATEDDQWARAASPGPWSPNAESDEVTAVDGITVADGFALSGRQLRATVEHIARHDPARVLAEVEVIRQVINDYRMSDRAILCADNPDLDDPDWRGIYAGRDAFASVLRAYAKAAGWQAEKPLPHHESE